MTATTLCLAAALLVAPATVAAPRLRSLRTTVVAGRPWRPPQEVTAVLCVLPVLSVGVAPAVAAAIVAGTTVRRVRRRRRDRARDAEQRALLAGLETVVAELEVGTHPADACATAARETTGPTADAFRVAAARARLGGSAADGLRAVAGATEPSGIAASLDRVAGAWEVSDRYGLALAQLLAAARADLSGRMRLRSRTEAGLAGARATAAVLAALPALGVALGQMMGAAPVSVLLGDGVGGVLLVVGTVLACAGLLWTDRIATRAAS
ncbi:secretion protein F [Rhodococcus indonesiensis]